MNNEMPTMPGAEGSSLPGEKEIDSDKGLPSYVEPEKSDSEVNVPVAPKKGIAVTAMRKGFFGQMRKEEGDKFVIGSEKNFGDWFTCDEPSMEKLRVKFYEDKKAKK